MLKTWRNNLVSGKDYLIFLLFFFFPLLTSLLLSFFLPFYHSPYLGEHKKHLEASENTVKNIRRTHEEELDEFRLEIDQLVEKLEQAEMRGERLEEVELELQKAQWDCEMAREDNSKLLQDLEELKLEFTKREEESQKTRGTLEGEMEGDRERRKVGSLPLSPPPFSPYIYLCISLSELI
jgi:benzoyl-CoA reductase/2-hydroxyglutaryl-CoA dehydratase subunit BcrC/BadD/HgdB